MILQHTPQTLPFVPNPCVPYGAQGLDASVLIWRDDQDDPIVCFLNGFQTTISVVDWSLDGRMLLAGSMTGEVLVWDFTTGERILVNRHAHSYAPICGLSWAPGGRSLVAITMAQTLQVWHVATRTCLVLPCQGSTTTITWTLDGSAFKTNDGVVWNTQEEGECE